jgi:3-oxoacyl-[acyl-carrier protein] reductase
MSDARRVALISGASRGIGAATARELGGRGYHVIVNYLRRAAAAAAVVEASAAAGGSAQAVRADVCAEDQVAALVGGVFDEHGRIDALVCNADTVRPTFGPVVSLPWETFAGKIIGELSGAYFLTQRVLAIMCEQRAGRIVYVSSTAADRVIGSIAHSTAKAALNTFGVQVAGEAARYGVTVNTVSAGSILTDATAHVFTGDTRHYLDERSAHGAILKADDVGRVIALVLDDAFAATTGQVIRVDGGFDLLEQQLDGLAAQIAAHRRA